MTKIAFTTNPKVTEIFDVLDKFLNFCREYGYRYNETDLNNFKSYSWQQYSKFTQGKNARHMWSEDARRFAEYRPA